jgi:G:T-mismatch repair DNA endonuclease (very short patch repair protein)
MILKKRPMTRMDRFSNRVEDKKWQTLLVWEGDRKSDVTKEKERKKG